MITAKHRHFPIRRLVAPCTVLLAGLVLSPFASADDGQPAAGSAAAAIREAGHPCAHVTRLERSDQGAAEGLTTWLVHCNSGTFSVVFRGDTGAEVVPLD